jgi:hypothetical protein
MAAPLLPPEIDPQDPLPDSSFAARRVFTFGGALLLFGHTYYARWQLPPGPAV